MNSHDLHRKIQMDLLKSETTMVLKSLTRSLKAKLHYLELLYGTQMQYRIVHYGFLGK